MVGRLGVGLDNIDLEAARTRGITVTAARNANAIAVVEPLPMESPLRSSEAVILTPHVAGLTAEAQERTSRLVISDVLRVLNGERAIGAV